MKHARTAVLAAALVAVSVESYAQGVDIGKRDMPTVAPFAMVTMGEDISRPPRSISQ
jgi:hypothetical protein